MWFQCCFCNLKVSESNDQAFGFVFIGQKVRKAAEVVESVFTSKYHDYPGDYLVENEVYQCYDKVSSERHLLPSGGAWP